MHEIAHALGMFHEQSRTDRDKYVTIKWDNIKEGKCFNLLILNSLGHINYTKILSK